MREAPLLATVPTPLDATSGVKLTDTAFDAGVRDPLNFLLDGEPRCHVSNATGVVIGNSATVYTLMTWVTETYDTDTMHDNVTNPSRVIFTTAGRYDVDVFVTLPAGAYTTLDMQLCLNSGGVSGTNVLRSQPFSDGVRGNGIVWLRFKRVFAAADYIEVFIRQFGTGGTQTTSTAGLASRVQAERMSAT